jgi:hypothetical protein
LTTRRRLRAHPAFAATLCGRRRHLGIRPLELAAVSGNSVADPVRPETVS